jgi:hypothetical protein
MSRKKVEAVASDLVDSIDVSDANLQTRKSHYPPSSRRFRPAFSAKLPG